MSDQPVGFYDEAAESVRTVSTAHPMPVTGGGTAGTPSTNVMSVQGFGYSPTITFTRPENTTAYDAGDVIGIADAGTAANAGSAIHTLTNAGPSGGEVLVTDVTVTIVLSAVPSGMSTFRVEIYNASPTAILDAAAFNLLAADKAKHVLTVDSITPIDKGAILRGRISDLREKIKLTTGSTDLYVELVTLGSFTPTSAESYTITLGTIAI